MGVIEVDREQVVQYMSDVGALVKDSVFLLYTVMGAFIEEYPWRWSKWSGIHSSQCLNGYPLMVKLQKRIGILCRFTIIEY